MYIYPMMHMSPSEDEYTGRKADRMINVTSFMQLPLYQIIIFELDIHTYSSTHTQKANAS